MRPDHGWRADTYTKLRDGFCLTVDRFWCTEDAAPLGWHWRVFDGKSEGCPTVEESESYSDLTFNEAVTTGEAALRRAKRAEGDPKTDDVDLMREFRASATTAKTEADHG